jgi:hypothetical protein
MKNQLTVLALILVSLTSCTSIRNTMREPNTRVEFYKSDFALSDQKSAEAKTVKIIGIDWARIFTKKEGTIEGFTPAFSSVSLATIPVIGNYMADRTSNYALYELMNSNPGHDVVFYPQYETKVVKPILGIGFITKITTVKATARLAKFAK